MLSRLVDGIIAKNTPVKKLPTTKKRNSSSWILFTTWPHLPPFSAIPLKYSLHVGRWSCCISRRCNATYFKNTHSRCWWLYSKPLLCGFFLAWLLKLKLRRLITNLEMLPFLGLRKFWTSRNLKNLEIILERWTTGKLLHRKVYFWRSSTMHQFKAGQLQQKEELGVAWRCSVCSPFLDAIVMLERT